MKKYNVGIIGFGFVGESQAFVFSPTSNVFVYDSDPLKSTHTIDSIHGPWIQTVNKKKLKLTILKTLNDILVETVEILK